MLIVIWRQEAGLSLLKPVLNKILKMPVTPLLGIFLNTIKLHILFSKYIYLLLIDNYYCYFVCLCGGREGQREMRGQQQQHHGCQYDEYEKDSRKISWENPNHKFCENLGFLVALLCENLNRFSNSGTNF